MELLKTWEEWARKNSYTSLTQDGIIKTMVTEFCKHLESIPVEKLVRPTERNLQDEQDTELGKKIRERIGSLETADIKADMIIMCAHILVRTMAETNAETAKWTIEDFSIAGKHYGNYLINIKQTKKK